MSDNQWLSPFSSKKWLPGNHRNEYLWFWKSYQASMPLAICQFLPKIITLLSNPITSLMKKFWGTLKPNFYFLCQKTYVISRCFLFNNSGDMPTLTTPNLSLLYTWILKPNEGKTLKARRRYCRGLKFDYSWCAHIMVIFADRCFLIEYNDRTPCNAE